MIDTRPGELLIRGGCSGVAARGQFGIDVRRYKPRTLVSVAYLSLQVSTDRRQRGRGDRPEEHWFVEGRRTLTGSSSLRAEAALAESPRTLLRGDAGAGKTTLLQWRDAAQRSAVELPCRDDELPDYERAPLRQLDGRRHLRRLASSPLLCAMLCAFNLDRRQQLPPDRMALYRDALPGRAGAAAGTRWRCCWNAAPPSARCPPAARSCWTPAANSRSCSTWPGG
jgi:hypothetical protein